MKIDEPSKTDVDRTVRSLKLVLALINEDHLASSGQAMIEAAFGIDVAEGLIEWIRNPNEKIALRNRFIFKMAEIWKGGP